MKRALPTPLNILSLGVGVQSTTLYYMSALGLIKRYDYALFADTGNEKKETYDYLKKLLTWSKKNNGPPIITCGKQNLMADLLKGVNSTGHKFITIPAYTLNIKKKRSMTRRQCTLEYKIRVIDKKLRILYNIKPNKWTPPTNIHLGITTDEAERINYSYKNWKTLVYPFCNYEATPTDINKITGYPIFTRQDCINWLNSNNFSVPVNSSCTFCPFQSDNDWIYLKNSNPEEFTLSIKLDKAIRCLGKKGVKLPIYLHSSLKPLDKVIFKPSDKNNFTSCSSGVCGL